MTIIAAKDGVMAADTMLSAFNSQSRAQKLVRLPDGGVAGGCGMWVRAYAGLQYLAAGGPLEGKDGPNVSETTLLVARPDGSLWIVDGEWPAYPLLDKVAAVGCGSDAAMMAMGLGLSAVEAVAKVTKQDVLCGDPVQSMDVYRIPDLPGAVTHVAPKPKAQKARGRKAKPR